MPTLEHHPTIVSRYDSRVAAEAAMESLQRAGHDTAKLVVLTPLAQPLRVTGPHVVAWTERGFFRGAVAGVVVAGALLLLPFAGPLTVVGPLAGRLVAIGLLSTAGGALGAMAALGTDALMAGYRKTARLAALRDDSYVLVAPNPQAALDAQRALERTAPRSSPGTGRTDRNECPSSAA